VAIGPDVNGRQISHHDAYTLTFGDLTDNVIPDGAVRPYVVRIGLVPEGASAVMGSDDEKIGFVFSLAGSATLTDESNTIEAGHYVSPFFGLETKIEATGGPALVGYIAQGPVIAIDDAAA
jgi:hypothetical protein